MSVLQLFNNMMGDMDFLDDPETAMLHATEKTNEQLHKAVRLTLPPHSPPSARGATLPLHILPLFRGVSTLYLLAELRVKCSSATHGGT